MNKFVILVRYFTRAITFFSIKLFVLYSERDYAALQAKLKDSKKVTMREPTPTPTIQTHSRLAQTDPWAPSPPVNDKPDDGNQEMQAMMQTKIEALEQKYQSIIEQKNSQIQQMMQEV
jgi:hypothetical protein